MKQLRRGLCQLTGMAAVGIGVFLLGILPSVALLVGGFALDGQAVAGFSADDLQGAVRTIRTK